MQALHHMCLFVQSEDLERCLAFASCWNTNVSPSLDIAIVGYIPIFSFLNLMSTNVKHSLLVVRQASHLTNIHIPAVGQRPFLVRLVGSSQVPTSKRSLKNFKPNSKAFVCSPPSLNTAFHKDGSWLRTPKVREETDAFPSTHRREMGTLAVRQNCGLPKKHREGFVSPSEFDRGFCSVSTSS